MHACRHLKAQHVDGHAQRPARAQRVARAPLHHTHLQPCRTPRIRQAGANGHTFKADALLQPSTHTASTAGIGFFRLCRNVCMLACPAPLRLCASACGRIAARCAAVPCQAGLPYTHTWAHACVHPCMRACACVPHRQLLRPAGQRQQLRMHIIIIMIKERLAAAPWRAAAGAGSIGGGCGCGCGCAGCGRAALRCVLLLLPLPRRRCRQVAQQALRLRGRPALQPGRQSRSAMCAWHGMAACMGGQCPVGAQEDGERE